ncbi:MAG TPA: phospholipase D-like domain-containing protein, partial [Ktedonobacterales bacterium]|nr:phospholipase D-like domain-containing protein [Ktedonobacterales bacterium]
SDHHGHEAHAGRTGKGAHATQSDARFWFLHDPRFIAAPTHGFAPGREQDFMHNKAIIIDDRLVFTGSYNFSENAEANDETLLAIESPSLAAAYTAYFDTLEATYAHSAAREPVAVGAAVAASAGASGHGASHGASGHGDDVVARLREEHARSEHAAAAPGGHHEAKRGTQRGTQREAKRSSKRRAPRRASRLDGAIRLTLVLLALTALALVVYAALAMSGVLF